MLTMISSTDNRILNSSCKTLSAPELYIFERVPFKLLNIPLCTRLNLTSMFVYSRKAFLGYQATCSQLIWKSCKPARCCQLLINSKLNKLQTELKIEASASARKFYQIFWKIVLKITVIYSKDTETATGKKLKKLIKFTGQGVFVWVLRNKDSLWVNAILVLI